LKALFQNKRKHSAASTNQFIENIGLFSYALLRAAHNLLISYPGWGIWANRSNTSHDLRNVTLAGKSLEELNMADIISKLKVSALVAGAAFIVVACGEKAPEATAEVTVEQAAPEAAVEAAPVEEAAAMDDAAVGATPVEETAPAAE